MRMSCECIDLWIEEFRIDNQMQWKSTLGPFASNSQSYWQSKPYRDSYDNSTLDCDPSGSLKFNAME